MIDFERPEHYEWSELYRIIGAENFDKIHKIYGGRSIYIPQSPKIYKELRDAEIRAYYNGTNTEALSRQYRLSTRQIRRIVKEKTSIRTRSRR